MEDNKMSLKDLAKQAGVNTGDKVEKAPETQKEPEKKTVGDLVGKAKASSKKAPKKEKKPRVVVDDDWVASLTKKADEKFGGQERLGNGHVEFTVAKSKGRFVSLTPKLVYEDGLTKSAGPKNRVGFCTNGDWDKWFDKLEKALEAAHAAERKTPKTRKASGQWASFSISVKEAMGEDVTVKSISKKLTVKDPNGNRVTLKREGQEALVGSAAGDPGFITKVLKSVEGAAFKDEDAATA
jgi:hypothetical protein